MGVGRIRPIRQVASNGIPVRWTLTELARSFSAHHGRCATSSGFRSVPERRAGGIGLLDLGGQVVAIGGHAVAGANVVDGGRDVGHGVIDVVARLDLVTGREGVGYALGYSSRAVQRISVRLNRAPGVRVIMVDGIGLPG